MGNNQIKSLIFRLTPKKLIKFYQKPLRQKKKIEENVYGRLSYSQEGEDLLLSRIFEKETNGFFVDIGAHHPQRFSNTYLLYKKGWTGINIDAMPGSMKLFEDLRPRDINLEVGVSNSNREMEYFLFNEPALNTFSKSEVEKLKLISNYQILDKIVLKTFSLEEILAKHLISGSQINYLNIDVEGLDLLVLKSNNWHKFSPEIISVELLNMSSIEDVQRSETYNFLISKDYDFFAKTWNTCFFKKRKNSY